MFKMKTIRSTELSKESSRVGTVVQFVKGAMTVSKHLLSLQFQKIMKLVQKIECWHRHREDT